MGAWILSVVMLFSSMATAVEERHFDGYRGVFEKGRSVAVSLLNRSLSGQDFPESSEAVVQWVLENQEELAQDIRLSGHSWFNDQGQEYCAQTELTMGSPIQLSLVACRRSVHSVQDAVEILVHESVHHLGEADEWFATQVGVAVGGMNSVDQDRNWGLWQARPISEMRCQNQRYPFDENSLAYWRDRIFVYGQEHESDDDSQDRIPCGGVYDLENETWIDIALPDYTSIHAVIQRGPLVYLLADGYSGNYYWMIFDFERMDWRTPSAKIMNLPNFGVRAIDAGDRMILWGGSDLGGDSETKSNRGYIYMPAEDRWYTMSTRNAPRPRSNASGAWGRGKLLIWSGSARDGWADAGIYLPRTNRWTRLAKPPQRVLDFCGGFSTGREAFDYDGKRLNRFSFDRWRWTEAEQPPLLWERETLETYRNYLWTGSELVATGFNLYEELEGLLYLPNEDRWEELNMSDGPSKAFKHNVSIVSMGDRLFYYGLDYQGVFYPLTGTGGQ